MGSHFRRFLICAGMYRRNRSTCSKFGNVDIFVNLLLWTNFHHERLNIRPFHHMYIYSAFVGPVIWKGLQKITLIEPNFSYRFIMTDEFWQQILKSVISESIQDFLLVRLLACLSDNYTYKFVFTQLKGRSYWDVLMKFGTLAHFGPGRALLKMVRVGAHIRTLPL